MKSLLIRLAFAAVLFTAPCEVLRAQTNPILFVTQVPTPTDSATVGALFGNHGASMIDAPRGGDLMIRYPDGSVKNLTKLAGFGVDGLQSSNAIAVRQPSVHWSGTKAIFSMVVGGATKKGDTAQFYWQLYEVTGLGKAETPVITKVPNQPADYNNVSPIYGTDDRIIFTTDRPITGERHLYPSFDEYKGTHTNTGLWSLDAKTGDLFVMDNSPSGDFSPTIDSYGRVLVMRWDRLQRDRNADIDALGTGVKGTFNYTDESATGAPQFGVRTEYFPEPQGSRTDLLAGTNMLGFEFNQFFPWMINEDGTTPETINHLGRHEMRQGINRSVNDDPNVVVYNMAASGRSNQTPLTNFTQVTEDPKTPGLYYGIDAQQFNTHSGGQIVSVTAQPTLDPDQSVVTYVTNRATQFPLTEGASNAAHTGFYRNPLPTSDGLLIAAHSVDPHSEKNLGTPTNPLCRFDFKIKTLKKSGNEWVADQPLTPGFTKSLSYYDPNTLITYNGPMWELDPVEVRVRAIPPRHTYSMGSPEVQTFADQSVEINRFKKYLKQKNLAVAVMRDVTHRDAADHQQPFYLKVDGSSKQSANATGKIYDISHMQFYQGDYVRGVGLTSQSATPKHGRRILAVPMHDDLGENAGIKGMSEGSVKVAADGSVAAFVPTRRAITWELMSPKGEHIVRERYWVTYQPGDVRTCASCHGTNDAALNPKNPIPQNSPEALKDLLVNWKSRVQPAHVTLNAPANAASLVKQAGNLQWAPESRSTYYKVQLAEDAQFNTIVLEQDSVATSQAAFTNLKQSTTYYWRVMGANDFIHGTWSDTWSFTTEGPTASVEANAVTSLTMYPDPISTRATIGLSLERASEVSFSIFDVQGKRVVDLSPSQLSSGQHEVGLDLSQYPHLSTGSYVLRVQIGKSSLDRMFKIVK